MLVRIAIYVMLLIIVYCLGSALYYMLSKRSSPTSMAKALTWRIVLSLLVFIGLMISFAMGWIQPHGV